LAQSSVRHLRGCRAAAAHARQSFRERRHDSLPAAATITH
jgi:hypothetical protein